MSRVAEELIAWVDEERALFRAGKHPLAQVTTSAG
jgi:hypothetical protein